MTDHTPIETPSGGWGIPGRDVATLTSVVGTAVAAKVVLLFWLSWNTRFVMDEFSQFGHAKYLWSGIYTTIWPIKAIGYAVFYEPVHWIGWNARSMLLAGRIETAILACGTLALVYGIARTLGESRLRALFILLVLLSFSNFMERIFRTISEPLAVFFAAAALLAVVRGRAGKWAVIGAGVLSGLAFVTTQKSLYFNLALGLALVGDTVLARTYTVAVKRGLWLVLGWLISTIGYCLVFGGPNAIAVAKNLIVGPVSIESPEIAAAYGGLRQYVVQTLTRNFVLYVFCCAGMILQVLQIRRLEERRRIALIFTIVITALVFGHDQPWPYVFIMALPFMALWALVPIDALTAKRPVYLSAAWGVLMIAIATSYAANLLYLKIDDRDQLELVERAEALVAPDEHYFDGIGMLPNRYEPSYRWLDRHNVLATLKEGKNSYPYQLLAKTPPKIIIWSYRMDAIEPVIDPLIRPSYVQISPNIRIAGVQLHAQEDASFVVPLSGAYALYDANGDPIDGDISVDGKLTRQPVLLKRGIVSVTNPQARGDAFLIPEGSYQGQFRSGIDDKSLFAGVYE